MDLKKIDFLLTLKEEDVKLVAVMA